MTLDYSKGKIYKLYYVDDESIFYIGSTIKRYLCDRREDHKQKSKVRKTKLYEQIKENGGWDKFKIKLIKLYPCENKHQLHDKERHYIKKLKPSLNTIEPPFATEEEMRLNQNKKSRENYIKHPEWKKNQREKIKCDDCGNVVSYNKMKRHKKESCLNPERKTCPQCQKEISPSNLKRHLKICKN